MTSSRKLKIAFIATSGLWYGGTEKCTQKQAIALREAGHDVDYYYTASTHYSNGSIHPGLDPQTKSYVESAGINTIEIMCESIDAFDSQKMWHSTNLFDIFNPSEYDLVIGNHKGDPMWPYSNIRGPKLLEVVHGTEFSKGASTYADGYVLITNYQFPTWKKSGGIESKTVVIPQMVFIQEPQTINDRDHWNLPKDKFIFGLHQGARTGLFSSVILDAFSRIQSDTNYFVILGGDPEYANHAARLGLTNFKQLSSVSVPEQISSFLSCLDVYAHGRFDGEVSSSAIVEAMARSLPLITHPSIYNNGHLEQIHQTGFIARSIDEYASFMSLLESNEGMRKFVANKSRERYESIYEHNKCKSAFVSFAEKICHNT